MAHRSSKRRSKPAASGRLAALQAQVRKLREELEVERQFHEELLDSQRELEMSRERYANLYDFAPVGYLMLDGRGLIHEINLTAAGMFGEKRAAILGRPLGVFVSRADRQAVLKHFAALRRGEPQIATELTLGGEHATPLTIELSIVRFDLDTGAAPIHRYHAVLTDITERKKAADALRQSEHRFRQVTDSLPQLVWTCAADGPCDYLGPQWIEYTGKSEAEQLGYGWLEQLHPDDRRRTLEQWQATAAKGEHFEIAFRVRRHDGAYRWFRTLAVPLRDEAGQVVKWFGSNTDIDDMMRAEEVLRRSEERFRALAEALPLVVWSADATGAIDYCNPWGYAYGGVRPEEVHDWKWMDLIHTNDLDATFEVWQAALASGQPFRSEFRLRRADGEFRWHKCQGVPLRDAEGRVTRWIGTATDIHDQKEVAEILEQRVAERTAELSHAEKELRRAGAYNRTLIETSPDPLVTIGPDGKITDVNRATEQFTGRARNELVGTDFSDYFTEPERAQSGYREVFAKGQIHDYALELRHRDGPIFHVLYNASVYRDEAGKVVGVFAAARDVTLRRQAEGELQRAHDELETRANQLRALAAELTLAEQRERKRLALVLHDGLQQMLVAAKFRLVLLERSKNVAQACADVSSMIDDCIETSRSLTSELSPPILHQGGLIPALEWLVQWMRDKHGLSVDLTSKGQHGRLREEITILLFQSVRELLFNVAKHAGTRKARIEVTQLDGRIQVEVTDEGAGFDPEQIGDYANQEGSGMGLFSIRERLGYFGGTMKIDAARGQGARFSLIAPVTGEQAELKEFPAESRTSVAFATRPESTRGGSAKIQVVLVDDHPLMRQGLASLLRAEPDISVIGEASDGEAAIDLVRKTKPAVVLMDISMPGMDGIEATRRIHEQMPEVKIIGLSMFQEDEQGAAIITAGAIKYLPKTGPSDAVIETIRDCMKVADGTIVN
jgi:PAS domain S-box-containing protein